jgi:hypothetical protein
VLSSAKFLYVILDGQLSPNSFDFVNRPRTCSVLFAWLVRMAISQTPGRNRMRKIGMALAIAAVMSGSVATAQTEYAAQSSHDTNVYTQPAVPIGPKVQMLDCYGTTGSMGCGPGWVWRDGWRGWGCYPC